MQRHIQVFLCLAMCFASVPVAWAWEPPIKPKAKVEFRWVEAKPIEGLTDKDGFKSTCDPDSLVYPHKKVALALTAAEVTEARLTKHDFSGSGLSSENYSVNIHLTKQARAKLAATCDGDETRNLTVVVDGKYWGVYRYEKDKTKPLIAEEARAETFTPSVGYFSSKAEAERLVDAFK
jgi:hypothetical protein